ncbi:MAG: glutamate--tRNA ligase [Spirochaetaceae bacterium]|jgi:glutamyl-tRNA synthetase|nr:glutamate--tRNA ligase [Spirochaetaceae bacterium]
MHSTEKAAGKVRDRYAPSPTGLQHIGGVRTALFNYLFARSQGPDGKFLLRLEDTDRTRFDERYVQNLYDTFDWLGFRWDEGPDMGGPAGPYIQSERFELYKTYARELVGKGRAYYCFCSPQRIEEIRKQREAARSGESGYDRHCRTIDSDEAGRRAASGESCAIRLKIPLGETTRFHDRLLGDIEWKNDDVNPDPVLLKSDGFPTYHLANVVDDHLMGITHVMRAQEWIPSTPLHVIMYRSFGWEAPVFCHLPMVMGQDGKKLSKRHGATSIDEFRKQGYLSEALVNYIALLGSSYEEGRDLYSLEELARLFSLDKLNKAPAVFDYKKLEWYNGQYIRMKSDGELAGLILPYALEAGLFGKDGPDEGQKKTFTASMSLIRERLVFPGEAPAKLAYLFAEPPPPPPEEFFPKKAGLAETITLLEKVLPLVSKMALMNDEDAEQYIKDAAETEGVKLGDLMMPLRVAITGARVSPPLFGSLRLLGKDRAVSRVERALEALRGL